MKETILSVLKEINHTLLRIETILVYKEVPNTNQAITSPIKVVPETIEIIDDGKLKTSEIIAKMKKLFRVFSYYSDEQLDKYFPPVKTKRKFKYIQETDEENKSANDLDQSQQITLRERLLFELEYFKRENKHLDVDNGTLCAGSRSADGDVPFVSCDGSRVSVLWCYPDYAFGIFRSRSAVS